MFYLLFTTITIDMYQLSILIATLFSTWFIFWRVNKIKLDKKADISVVNEQLKLTKLQMKHQEVRLIEHDEKNDVQFKFRDEQFRVMNESINHLVDKTDEIYAILINFKK